MYHLHFLSKIAGSYAVVTLHSRAAVIIIYKKQQEISRLVIDWSEAEWPCASDPIDLTTSLHMDSVGRPPWDNHLL